MHNNPKQIEFEFYTSFINITICMQCNILQIYLYNVHTDYGELGRVRRKCTQMYVRVLKGIVLVPASSKNVKHTHTLAL